MIVVASVATTLFLGGWLRPFASVHELPGFHLMNFLDCCPRSCWWLLPPIASCVCQSSPRACNSCSCWP